MAGHDALQMLPVGYGDPLPEAFVDSTQEVLGTLGRLDLTLASATTIRALAGAGADEAAMGIGGALRWVTANVDRAMPAGGAGRYDVYVTTGATTISPGDPPTDTTNYAWDLAIVAQPSVAPSGGGVAYAKKVGYLDWSGAAITRLVQTFDGTAGMTFGGDVTLYRDGADVLRTDDNFWAAFNVAAQVGSAGQSTIGGVGPASQAGLLLNDATLYRAGAGLLRTPGSLTVDGTLTAGALAYTSGNIIGNLTVGGSLIHNGAALGFFGVAPAARPAARTLTNWAAGANARRAIDRATFTEQQLFDFVMTMADDLRTLGLYA
jgi:hypothetical protein